MPKYLDLKESEYELKQDEFYYGIDFDAKSALLDDIIKEELDFYYINNIAFNKPEEVYLNSEMQMKLIGEITAKVYVNRMTPAVLSNLSFYYNFPNEEALQKIIANKVSLAVLNLTLTTNNTNLPQH